MRIDIRNIRKDDIIFVVIHFTNSNFRSQSIRFHFLKVLDIRFIYYFGNISTHIGIPEDEIDQEMPNLNGTYRFFFGRIGHEPNSNSMIPNFFIFKFPFHDIKKILTYLNVLIEITQYIIDAENLCIVTMKQCIQRFFRMRFVVNVYFSHNLFTFIFISFRNFSFFNFFQLIFYRFIFLNRSIRNHRNKRICDFLNDLNLLRFKTLRSLFMTKEF